jgi:hypothetical protein
MKKNVTMAELLQGATQAGVGRGMAYWNPEFQRLHSPILRYGFAVVSVATAGFQAKAVAPGSQYPSVRQYHGHAGRLQYCCDGRWWRGVGVES